MGNCWDKPIDIINGTFDKDDAIEDYAYQTPYGWNSYGSYIIIIKKNNPDWINSDSPEPSKYIVGLQSINNYTSSINQILSCEPHSRYKITFNATYKTDEDVPTLGVYIDNLLVFKRVCESSWKKYTIYFIARKHYHVITFVNYIDKSNSTKTIYLDNVDGQ